jgi:hypothetical protein
MDPEVVRKSMHDPGSKYESGKCTKNCDKKYDWPCHDSNHGPLGHSTQQCCHPTFTFFFTATPRNSMLDSFFALKSGMDMGKASSSTSSQSTSMSFKNGQFSIEIDIQVLIGN